MERKKQKELAEREARALVMEEERRARAREAEEEKMIQKQMKALRYMYKWEIEAIIVSSSNFCPSLL